MSRLIKSKKFIFFISICILGSLLLIVFNLSQVQKYQLNRRNTQREKDLTTITNGIKDYIVNNNNLPTISNLDQNSFLPELLFINQHPSGGISIQSLENMQGYFDLNMKDPFGNPYLIGTSGDKVIIYTPNFEVYKSANEVYFKSLKIKSSTSGTISAEEE